MTTGAVPKSGALMATPSSTPATAPPTPTLTPLAKYALLLLLLIGSLVGSYWLKLYPNAIGFSGAGTAIVGLFSFASADLEATPVPAKLPKYTTFLVITLAAGIYGALGAYMGDTFATVTAFLAWFLLIVEYVLTTFRTQAEQYIPTAYDSWIVAGLGLFVVAGQFYLANPTAGFAALLVTLAVAVPSYINVTGS